MKIAALFVLTCAGATAHDIITTPITWGHEISAIVAKHCVSCHQPDGQAFSLLTYKDVRPWAVAIREETLKRTMPPWGAIKGFGDFANDNSLTPEEIELIVKWTEGGVPEGEEKSLQIPPVVNLEVPFVKARIEVIGVTRLKHQLTLTRIAPTTVPSGVEFKIAAEFPDGSIEPLLWLNDHAKSNGEFILRKPIILPAGTTIRGVPKDAKVSLLETAP